MIQRKRTRAELSCPISSYVQQVCHDLKSTSSNPNSIQAFLPLGQVAADLITFKTHHILGKHYFNQTNSIPQKSYTQFTTIEQLKLHAIFLPSILLTRPHAPRPRPSLLSATSRVSYYKAHASLR